MLKNHFEFKERAVRRTIDAVRKLPDTAPKSIVFVTQQLNHMTIVEEFFKSRLSYQSDAHGNTNITFLPNIDTKITRKLETNNFYLEFVKNLTMEGQDRFRGGATSG